MILDRPEEFILSVPSVLDCGQACNLKDKRCNGFYFNSDRKERF